MCWAKTQASINICILTLHRAPPLTAELTEIKDIHKFNKYLEIK